jgi:putative transposase
MSEPEYEEERFVAHGHAPPHLFRAGAAYFITAKTLHGADHMARPSRRQQVIDALHVAAEQRRWEPVAWVVLSNHYHCILLAPPEGASALPLLMKAVHRFTAREWNREAAAPGREVWYQYWDTCLTHAGSFWARLNYIHYNPVRHGLVRTPDAYPFSSYSRWRQMEDVSLVEIEGAYPWDRLDLE